MSEINKFATLLGEHIKAIRKRMNLKRTAFATLVEMSEDAIGLIERGEKLPRLDTLYKIAKNLNIPIVKLLDFEKNITKSATTTSLSGLHIYLKAGLPKQISKIQRDAQRISDTIRSLASNKKKR